MREFLVTVKRVTLFHFHLSAETPEAAYIEALSSFRGKKPDHEEITAEQSELKEV